MDDPKEHFKYGLVVVEAAQRLRELQVATVRFVDQEVIPPFDGSPEGIAIWFICETRLDGERFRDKLLKENVTKLKAIMIDLGFPSEAANTLWFDVTSNEAIEAGGGRFAFFR